MNGAFRRGMALLEGVKRVLEEVALGDVAFDAVEREKKRNGLFRRTGRHALPCSPGRVDKWI